MARADTRLRVGLAHAGTRLVGEPVSRAAGRV